jgi:dimeric dUTPase (all-alpha-NTP-PPase superfamily)
MLNRAQAQNMLTLQSAMNAKVNPEWLKAAYPYLRAVVIEGAEAMEHKGWKWWKRQECDLEQLRMELVDIWHFMLSHLLLEHNGNENAALDVLMSTESDDDLVFDNTYFSISSMELLEKLELTIGLAAARRMSLPLFAGLLTDCQMDWQDLYCHYIGKNVLNFFRQDNGYKVGTYRKLWDGREDNEHLVEIMADLDSNQADFQHALYASLQDRYNRSQ